MSKFSNAFSALFLDKKARKSLKNKKLSDAKPVHQASAPPPADTGNAHLNPEQLHAQLDTMQKKFETKKKSPGRQQLIQDALKIRAEQSKLLDDLSPEQKLKLQYMAMKSFQLDSQKK